MTGLFFGTRRDYFETKHRRPRSDKPTASGRLLQRGDTSDETARSAKWHDSVFQELVGFSKWHSIGAQVFAAFPVRNEARKVAKRTGWAYLIGDGRDVRVHGVRGLHLSAAALTCAPSREQDASTLPALLETVPHGGQGRMSDWCEKLAVQRSNADLRLAPRSAALALRALRHRRTVLL